jgi:ankyrin repeat protein
MTKAFWIISALDAVAFATLLVIGLNEKGHNSRPSSEAKKQQVNPNLEGHYAILETLLQHGASPKHMPGIACWPKEKRVLQTMFAAGADPTAISEYGNSLGFFDALSAGRLVGSPLPLAEAFVEAGADVNRALPSGGFPASFATNWQRYDFAAYWVDHGARTDSCETRSAPSSNTTRR